MDDVPLGQFVQHCTHDGKKRRSFFGVGGVAQVAHGVAGRLVLVTVAVALLLVGTNALEG